MKLMRYALAAVVVLTCATAAHAADLFVYFGTQDKTPGTGFSLAHFDTQTGALTKPKLVLAADSPSFFVIHPDGKHLYSTNFGGIGGISSYAIDPKDGGLTPINRISGNNTSTTFVGLDRSATVALAANFDAGHLAAFPLRADGGFGERTFYDYHTGSSVNPARQTKTYPHFMTTDPTNRFALVPDLGLDKVFIYHFNAQGGSFVPSDPPFVAVQPGAGPRHLRFHPNTKWAYLLCEMGSLVNAYHWDETKGTLQQVQSVSLIPEDFKGENTSAELEIHPNGKFLYASNRWHDSIAVFAIDPADGKLTLVERVGTQGKNPRNFAIDPTGKWMLCTNQASNTAVVFKMDGETGKLTQVGPLVEVPAPCCERFLAVAP